MIGSSRWILGIAALVVALGSGCSPQAPETGRLRVVATTGLIADAARQVGGPYVDVTALMGPGIDPHRYLPTPLDLDALHRADLVLFNGLHLEGKMTDVLGTSSRAVAVAAGIPTDKIRTQDHEPDPHVWFDVRLWKECVAAVREALAKADPAHADAYRANAQKYLGELAKLDDEVRTKANSIPKERRVLVTSHDAFGYFADAYGFEVHGLQGVSTASEPSTKDKQDLVNLLGSRRIPAVFGETSVPPKGLQSVLDAVRSDSRYGHDVRLIGGEQALYSDALGEPGSPGETYVGMVRHNIDTIVAGLGK